MPNNVQVRKQGWGAAGPGVLTCRPQAQSCAPARLGLPSSTAGVYTTRGPAARTSVPFGNLMLSGEVRYSRVPPPVGDDAPKDETNRPEPNGSVNQGPEPRP